MTSAPAADSRGLDALAVFLGGCVGTLARWALGVVWPGLAAIAVVNLVGACALGSVSVRLSGRAKLAVGTGFLGAFTTYGGMAVAAVVGGWAGLGWACALVILGVGAAMLGRRLA